MELIPINPNTLINQEMISCVEQIEGKLIVTVGMNQYIIENSDEFLQKLMKSDNNLTQQYFAG